MFDFSHLPQNATVAEFIGPSGIRAWHKPPNATFVFMMCIGGGGGGGTGSSNSTGGGGGGGSSGGLTQAMFLAWSLPNTLYVVFDGSSGASASGANVFIGNYASTSANVVSKYIPAGGGLLAFNGSVSAGGAGASAPSAISASDATLLNYSIYAIARAGRAGVSGSTSAASSQSIGSAASTPILGGCGGSGNINQGGGFTTDISLLVPSISGGSTGGSPASNGLSINRPFLSIGGMGGGGASALLPGGAGGTAPGYGAGGGGGGAGGTAASAGGNGGPAYACIIAW